MRWPFLSSLLALALGASACDGTFVIDPDDPPIDLTVAAHKHAADPLVYVDGVLSSLSALHDIDRSRIATVEIVKGVAATAIYGSRGREGVIHISLKP
jgi:hypothetical protein